MILFEDQYKIYFEYSLVKEKVHVDQRCLAYKYCDINMKRPVSTSKSDYSFSLLTIIT